MTVSFLGWPMVRLTSKSRSLIRSTAARRIKDQVVAQLDLREEQSVFNAGVLAFSLGEEWRQRGEPFLSTGAEIVSGERIGDLLQPNGIGTTGECIRRQPEADSLLFQTVSDPVVLV